MGLKPELDRPERIEIERRAEYFEIERSRRERLVVVTTGLVIGAMIAGLLALLELTS